MEFWFWLLSPRYRGGVYILYNNHQKEQARLASEQAALEAKHEALKDEFETQIAAFASDMQNIAQQYKEQRRVLNDLLRPINLRTPEYIAENAQIAEKNRLIHATSYPRHGHAFHNIRYPYAGYIHTIGG